LKAAEQNTQFRKYKQSCPVDYKFVVIVLFSVMTLAVVSLKVRNCDFNLGNCWDRPLL